MQTYVWRALVAGVRGSFFPIELTQQCPQGKALPLFPTDHTFGRFFVKKANSAIISRYGPQISKALQS